MAPPSCGINGHHAYDAVKIGRYSAGCWVRASEQHHKRAYALAKKYLPKDGLIGLTIINPNALINWIEKMGDKNEL
jgi:aspartate carbamoyltransferase regulatory subunit